MGDLGGMTLGQMAERVVTVQEHDGLYVVEGALTLGELAAVLTQALKLEGDNPWLGQVKVTVERG